MTYTPNNGHTSKSPLSGVFYVSIGVMRNESRYRLGLKKMAPVQNWDHLLTA